MNRNTESRFALTPSVSINRSKFHRDSGVKTSGNVGELIPFYLDEVLPGDEFKVKTSKVIRMPSFITAPMDNLFADFYYFFVPQRLVWSHSKELFGENNESAWVPETEYSVPQLTSPEGGWETGTIADYFGLPVGIDNLSVNALPVRGYALIVDQWFRSTVVDDPVNVPIGDSTVVGSNGDNYVTDLVKGGKPFIANKYFDLFTSCSPAPQRGNDVLIPLGDIKTTGTLTGSAPVKTLPNLNDFTYPMYGLSWLRSDNGQKPTVAGTDVGQYTSWAENNENLYINGVNGWTKPSNSYLGVIPANLGVDLSDADLDVSTSVSAGSINQLRLAFQIQKWYEKLAIGGDRYIEIIKSMFGVTSPDARLQRTEYLGGNRVPITINSVISQTGTASAPQGTVTGQSLTTDNHYDFDRSFTEHGFVIGLMVLRYDHTYTQGLDAVWSRKDKFSYYWPVFANIGAQAIKNSRIYCQGSAVIDEDTGKPYDDEVFGYNEAWSEYRYKPNICTGLMRPQANTTLASWNFADDYDTLPSLSSAWMKEDKVTVDRTLAVTSQVTNQFFADIWVENTSTRPLPLYSAPGFIDHH